MSSSLGLREERESLLSGVMEIVKKKKRRLWWSQHSVRLLVSLWEVLMLFRAVNFGGAGGGVA